MKNIKIITTIVLLLTLPMTISAGIKFRSTSSNFKPKYSVRTVTPKFSIEQTNHNPYIELSAQKQNHQPTSYLTNDTHWSKTKQYRQNIHGSSQSYYHRYSSTSVSTQNVSYNQHISMKAYNPANNKPFDGNAIATTQVQYAFGPPQEGPISDIILPLLVFVAIYLVNLKYRK